MLCNSSGTRSGIIINNFTVRTHLTISNECFFYKYYSKFFNASNGSNSRGLQTHENKLSSICVQNIKYNLLLLEMKNN